MQHKEEPFNVRAEKVRNEKIAKDLIVKKFFDSEDHKKIVIDAVRKSSQAQEELIAKYDAMVTKQ